jgi:predicted RNase H-like HicB family nuclease
MSKITKEIKKQIEKHINMDYSFTINKDTEADGCGYYYAQTNELPGCIADGKTPEEALEKVQAAMYDWFETALLNGDKIPTPEGYSGKFSVRIPPSLHKDLVIKVKREGVSINQFISTAIARAVGF